MVENPPAGAAPITQPSNRTSAGNGNVERTLVPYEPQAQKLGNNIRTTKYCWWTFIPMNLFEQFHNLSNVYFLGLTIMQAIPAISITGGLPTIGPALLMVMGATALKDLIEDYKRGRSDQAENASVTCLLESAQDMRTVTAGNGQSPVGKVIPWSAVRAGMVLRVKEGERLPADALLIASDDPEGACLVETCDLDGETNLKRKVTVPVFSSQQWTLACEGPSSALYDFRGKVVQRGKVGLPDSGVGINNLLLRGTTLRCSEWVVCMVVYCGHETRLMMNTHGARFKQSRLDRVMNRLMIAVFILQVSICLLAGTLYSGWMSYYEQCPSCHIWYMHVGEPNVARPFNLGIFIKDALLSSASWELQMGNMVPISLIVCQMMVKLGQAFFIGQDRTISEMVSDRWIPTSVQTSQVLENLGQVTHVFSDKTGTLTQNVMEFRACSINGKLYGANAGILIPRSPGAPKVPYYDFNDEVFQQDVGGSPHLARFVLGLASCHTVSINSRNDNSSDVSGRPQYEASSPDELAMVSAANSLGLEFHGCSRRLSSGGSSQLQQFRLKDPNGPLATSLRATLSLPSPMTEELQLEVLDVCEFDNDRKRMSVVVRTLPGARPLLLLKGADSSVLPFIEKACPEDIRIAEETDLHLKQFSCTGLRTLLFAERELGDEYEDWHLRHEAALASLALDRGERLSALAAEIEEGYGLRLVGATAIEDKLQDGVPQVIESMRKCGIIVWVLTGDKLETAMNIGLSCKLLTPQMESYELESEIPEEIEKALLRVIQDPSTGQDRALAITGTALTQIFKVDTHRGDFRRLFFRATQKCASVLCCRVSPKQKADVVKLVMDLQRDSVSLSIGDGANDVSMITTADVGVGLSGKEGAQAARAADFSMSQFQFLGGLLFKHGRESSRRNSLLVAYNFYKNTFLCGAALLYGEYMSFSGQTMYDAFLYQLYNVIFSTFPIIFFATFDRPIDDLQDLVRCPQKWYPPGREGVFFNKSLLVRWLLLAIFHAYLVHVFGWRTFDDGCKCGAYTVGDLWSSGAGIFYLAVLGVNVCLVLQHSSHMWLTLLVSALSVCSYPVTMHIASKLRCSAGLAGSFSFLFGFSCMRFWLASAGFIVILSASTMFFLECPLLRLVPCVAGSTPAEQCWDKVMRILHKWGILPIRSRCPPRASESMGFELHNITNGGATSDPSPASRHARDVRRKQVSIDDIPEQSSLRISEIPKSLQSQSVDSSEASCPLPRATSEDSPFSEQLSHTPPRRASSDISIHSRPSQRRTPRSTLTIGTIGSRISVTDFSMEDARTFRQRSKT